MGHADPTGPGRGHEGVRGWLGTGTGTVSPDRQGAGPDSARGSCSGEPGHKAPRPCPWQRTLFTPCTCLQAVRLKTLHGKHPSVPGTVLGSDTGELPAQQTQDGNSVPPVFIAPAQQPSNNGPRGAAGTVGTAGLLPAPSWDPSGATNSLQDRDKATAPRLSPVHPAAGDQRRSPAARSRFPGLEARPHTYLLARIPSRREASPSATRDSAMFSPLVSVGRGEASAEARGGRTAPRGEPGTEVMSLSGEGRGGPGHEAGSERSLGSVTGSTGCHRGLEIVPQNPRTAQSSPGTALPGAGGPQPVPSPAFRRVWRPPGGDLARSWTR